MIISFDNNFKSEVDARVYGLSKIVGVEEYLIDEECYSSSVEWTVEPELRERCIKSMNLTIKKVTSQVNWSYENEKEEKVEGIIEFDTSLPEYSNFEIDNQVYFEHDGGVHICLIEIDFENKKIIVSE